MSLGGPTEVGSIKATVGLDTGDLKRGLDQAKQALSESARMMQDALRFTNDLAKGIDKEADSTRRANLLKQQQAVLDREMSAAKSQLNALLAGESAAAQQVAAKYSLVDAAQQRNLATIKEQITAQRALQDAQLAAGIAAEKAAMAEVAASEKAAAASIAAAEKASAAQLAAARKNFGRNLSTIGSGLTSAVTTPIVGAALAAGYAGQQVGQADATLRAGTGLSGGALAGVEDSFKRIAPQVSQPLKVVADAVAELERRTGETGPALEKLAVAELNLQRVTGAGNDLFKQSAQVFAAWNIPVEQQVPLLNELLRAHQLTGISVNTLLASVAKSAPTFQAMGKSVEDSIATFGAFNKVGIQPERLVTAMNTAMGKLAKAGVPDVSKALADMLLRIQNLKDPTEALNEAVRLFGARGGTQLANELRKGTLSIGQLEAAIKNGSETVSKAAKDTETFSVVWGQMRNAVEIALAPLGKVILQFVVLAAQALKPAVEWLGKVLEAFGKLSPGMQEFILGALAVVAVIGPIVSGIGSLITTVTALRAAWVGIMTVLGATEGLAAIPLLLNPITLALGALAGAAALVALNWDTLSSSFKTGIGVLERLPGNLAAGYGISSALNRSMQDAAGANQGPNANVSGGGGLVPTPQFSGPEAYQRSLKPPTGIPGLSAAEQQAMFGKGAKPKLSEAQKEDQRAVEQMLKDQRELGMLQRGESVDVARLAGEYPHLSAARLEEIVASRKQLDAAVKATESRKAYGKDLEKLNDEIRRLKAGHDAEAGGLDALKEKYPGLTKVQLAHIFAVEQYEKALNKLHETQKRVNERIAAAGVAFMGQTAATRAGKVALELFKEEADKFAAKYPGSTAQQFWNQLAPNQQRRAKSVAFQGASGDLIAQSDALDRDNAALYTGQRAQRYSQTVFGSDLGHLPAGTATDINRYFAKQDINQQREAGFDAFNAPIGQRNQLIGTINPQMDRLTEQFQALTGKSQAARQTMAQFGVVLKDLPKDTQQAVRGFLEMQNGLKFVQDFASGVEGVFQGMFSNLFQHGFKGFFSSVVQGFNQMLQKMAADYLSSQLANVVMRLLGPVLGSAFGGGAAADVAAAGLSGGAAATLTQAVPTFAAGGSYSGGPMLVGERGPELLFPHSSGTVLPHAQSMAMMGGGGQAPVTVNVHVHGVTDAQSFQAPQNRHAITETMARELQRANARRR